MSTGIQIVWNTKIHTRLRHILHIFARKGWKRVLNLGTSPKFRRIRARYKNHNGSQSEFIW